jgi:hypothetical protein
MLNENKSRKRRVLIDEDNFITLIHESKEARIRRYVSVRSVRIRRNVSYETIAAHIPLSADYEA